MTGLPRTVMMLLLSLALPLAGFGQDRAMLYPGEGITVNGKPTSITSALFAGDSVQTGKGAAQLTYGGATVQVEPGTTLQYGSTLQLGCGGVAVAGGMPVAVAGTAIVPSPAPARFQVVNRGGRLLISVQSGTVRLTDGQTIAAGQSTLRSGAANCAAPAPDPSHPARSYGKAIAIGGAVAGAATCGILCRGSDKQDISQSKP